MQVEQRRAALKRVERATSGPMLALAAVFAGLLIALEVAELPEDLAAAIEAFVWLIWGVFAFDLALRTYLAPRRGRYLLDHWLDVLVVLVPFLRPLRLLPLLVAGGRLAHGLRTTLRRRTFSLLGLMSLATLLLCAVLVYLFERGAGGPIKTLPDALWWAAATITTVGYGDAVPTTAAGRGVAVLLMLSGISLFGVLTARIAAFFVEPESSTDPSPRHDELLERLERLEHLLRQQAAPRE